MQQIKVIKKYSLSTKGMITQASVGHISWHSIITDRKASQRSSVQHEGCGTGKDRQFLPELIFQTKHKKESSLQEMLDEGTAGNGGSCGTAGSALPVPHMVLQSSCQTGNCKHKPFTNMRALCLCSIILSYNNCYMVLTLIGFVYHADFFSSYEEICLSVIPLLFSGTKGVHIHS